MSSIQSLLWQTYFLLLKITLLFKLNDIYLYYISLILNLETEIDMLCYFMHKLEHEFLMLLKKTNMWMWNTMVFMFHMWFLCMVHSNLKVCTFCHHVLPYVAQTRSTSSVETDAYNLKNASYKGHQWAWPSSFLTLYSLAHKH